MKLIISCIALITHSFYATAQQDVELPGVVVEQNSKIKTGRVVFLQGVSIKAVQSTPQLSDANGKFKLVFVDMPAGNVTRVDVSKNGYEVVNSKVLQSASITGRKAPLEVVMCKSGLLYENQLAYYTIASDAITEQYKKKIRILEEGGKNKDDLIARLQTEMRKEIKSKEDAIDAVKEQYRLQYAQSQMIADRFATVNLDDESETYQKAFQAFQAKDIEKALLLLDSVNLEKRLATNTSELKKELLAGPGSRLSVEWRKEQIKNDVSQCMFKARLHVLKSEYPIAKDAYLLAVKYDSLNTEHLWEVGSFFLNQKEEILARDFFDKILALSQSDYDKAVALSDAGKLYKQAGLYDEAERSYAQSVKLFQQLHEKEPEAYRKILTSELNNFGELYEELEYYTTAEKYYMAADQMLSEFYHRLDADMPDEERSVWAATIQHNAALYYKKKNFGGAEHAYQQVISLLERISEENSDHFKLQLASVLFNYGVISFYTKEYDIAGENLKKGLNKTELLAKQSPDMYSGELAGMLNTAGQLFYQLNALNKAEEFYTRALKIASELSGKNSSEAYLTHTSFSLNNLGLIQVAFKNYQKAAELFSKALAIQRELVQKKPRLYSGDLAAIFNNMGLMYYHSKSYIKAEQFYKEAVEVYSKLSDKNPEIYSPDLAKTMYNLGKLYDEIKDFTSAEKRYNEALEIQLRIINNEKQYFSPAGLLLYLIDVSATLDDLKKLYNKKPGLKPGKVFLDGLEEYNELKEKYQHNDSEIAQKLKKTGMFYTALEAYADAEETYIKAIELFKNGEKKYPPDAFKDFEGTLIETQVDLLGVYQSQLETTQNFSYREKALKLLKEIHELPELEDQYKYRIEVFDSVFKNSSKTDLQMMAFLKPLEELREKNSTNKDNALKISTEQEIIKQMEKKMREVPENGMLKKSLSLNYGSIAWYYVFEKQFQKAIESAKRGLTLDPAQTWIYSNLALGYLLQGNWPEAKEIYEKYNEEFEPTTRHSFKYIFLEDLKALREAGIISPLMRDAEELLLR